MAWWRIAVRFKKKKKKRVSHPLHTKTPPHRTFTGEAKACWQHAGEILSSRHARRLLSALQGHPPPDPTAGFPLPGKGEYGEGVRRQGGGCVTGAGDFLGVEEVEEVGVWLGGWMV